MSEAQRVRTTPELSLRHSNVDAPMLVRVIPGTQESLPTVGLGSWQTFDVGATNAQRAAPRGVLETFAQGGGTLIDSSPMYGKAETVIGDLLSELMLTERMFIATKVWTSGQRSGIEQMESSLRKFRRQALDLIQVHNLVDVETHLDTLDKWKAQGRVRYVGVTHYTASAHGAVATILRSRPIDFVQINYSLDERDGERSVLPLAVARGIAVIVNRPFAGGSLLTRLRNRPLPECAAALQCTSWAQLAIKFVISHPAVTCVIPATSNREHLRDFMLAGTGPMPDDKMREQIAVAARRA
jgi:diketogulonate reductase-like aldo/keto reductase